MLTDARVRSQVAAAHGVLALALGVAFFYLRTLMGGHFFETAAVTIAVLLAAGAFFLAAISDWFAAYSEAMMHTHRFVFYLLAGLLLALGGVLAAYYPPNAMQWLLGLAAAHALLFGVAALVFAVRARYRGVDRAAMYAFGAVSLAYSGTILALFRSAENDAAMGLSAAYLCFVGVKMLFFAWDLRRRALSAQRDGAIAAGAR